MARTIAIANQKGGVGKTTLTLNLGASLTKIGKKVCLIDCDPQANMTMALGCQQPDELPIAMPDIVQEIIKANFDEETSELMRKREYIMHSQGMDFIPSSIALADIENLVLNAISRENVLKKLINYIKDDYDFVLLDSIPSLNIMVVNVLNAADSVLIPVQPQFFSAKGLELLFSPIGNVKRKLNPNLEIAGALVTMYDSRVIFHRETVKKLEEAFSGYIKIFDTKIPMSIKATESQALSISIFEHEPTGKFAENYELFTQELLDTF